MKKLITIVLSVVLLSSALMGCGTNTSTSNETATTSEMPATETTTEVATETPTEVATETPVEAPVPTMSPEELDKIYPEITDASQLPQLQPVKDGDPIAVIHTSMGDVKVRLFPEQAPNGVANFEALAKKGYYDGIIFHRVIKDFMIQGGDPTGTGTGGETANGQQLLDEISPYLRNFNGALAYANAGPNTASSQFFIVENDKLDEQMAAQFQQLKDDQSQVIGQDASGTEITASRAYGTPIIEEYMKNGGTPTLDFGYTVFGQVYEGQDVVKAIAEVKTYTNDDAAANPDNIVDKPVEDITITGIDIDSYKK